MGDKGIDDDPDFWIQDEQNDLLTVSGKRKRKTKSKKLEFVGWGSKPLIDFLESICKDTSKRISLIEAENIVKDYINTNNLIDPQKKKRVRSDERLLSLFGKKSFPRIKIQQFLEKHFSDNQSDSDYDFLYSSEENDDENQKQHKAALSSNGKDVPKQRIKETPKSCFAAIIPANLKLLYLKRMLIEDLYKDEDTFEKKLVGSFVRIKSNPNDYLQKHSHQLQQVKGVKKPLGVAPSCSDILLELTDVMDDVGISMLSDDDFSEEECEDLRERIKSGTLKRPTTVEFQEKAEMLHTDITKNWLERELHYLQNLIDRANEKGWRKELYEHLERRQLLESPEEQKRLLLEVPKVIAEELEYEAKPEEETKDESKPILRMSSVISSDLSMATQTLATHIKPDEEIHNAPKPILRMSSVISADLSKTTQTLATQIKPNEEFRKAPKLILRRSSVTSTDRSMETRPLAAQDIDDSKAPENEVQVQRFEPLKVAHITEIEDTESEEDDKAFCVDPQEQKKVEPKRLPTAQVVSVNVVQKQQKNVEAKSIPVAQIIELSDDDDEEVKGKEEDWRTMTWHYVDPQGEVQGPFDLETLKRWSDAKYFPADFKVFQKTGCTTPVILSQLLVSAKL